MVLESSGLGTSIKWSSALSTSIKWIRQGPERYPPSQTTHESTHFETVKRIMFHAMGDSSPELSGCTSAYPSLSDPSLSTIRVPEIRVQCIYEIRSLSLYLRAKKKHHIYKNDNGIRSAINKITCVIEMNIL